MKSESRRSIDWIGPIVFFIPAMSIASIYGGYAETLQLPTAWFAKSSHIWMLVLIALSSTIPSPKWAKVVWLMGLSCVAYAPALVTLGSQKIPLSRSLGSEESADFRQRFQVPVLVGATSGEGAYIRVRHQDFTEAITSHLESIGALQKRSSSP